MASISSERASSSSSSSSSAPGRKHDVYLSFRGEDTHDGFTDHLYEALRQKRIHAFRDEEKLLREGEVFALDLMKAIEESQYAIIVLSKNYADSKWCLDELAKIVETREKTGLTVLPVFYHVETSDVRNQTGPFAIACAEHEKDNIEKIQKWRAALTEVGNLPGWHLNHRPELMVIQNIVGSIHSELYGEFLCLSKDLVGMKSRVEEVMDLLNLGLDDVRLIGMGGVGKSTLAEEIYCKISNQFDFKSFICIGSVGETGNDFLVPLQKQLLSNIFNDREVNITSVGEGKQIIRQRLRLRKVLIILDNVNEKDQLDALMRSRDWFGLGSRIIITSRDKKVLTMHGVDDMYETKRLDNDEALELFCQKAFKQPHPNIDFVDLCNDFLKYAKGLPLALEVFGSSLFLKEVDVWKSFLDQLNENPNEEIVKRLEISYKGLEHKVKELFLDIAFFFKGMDKNRVVDILGISDYYVYIQILKDKSLITILGGKLWMHDLLQQMGREIVHCEAPEEPRLRSRLWHHKDIFSVLKNNNGTKNVEGMMLNSPPLKEDLSANAFSEMTRLRLIKIHNVLLPEGLNYLSNELQMMEWLDYPLKSMPRSFQPNNLIELIMHHSHIEQLPEGFSNLDKLKLMDLSYSQNLINTPDFIGFRNLERLIFQGCTRLYKIHPSVGALRRLILLNLKDCKCLKSLPHEINLESLKNFILSGCSRLKKFPEVGRNMTCLSELYLNGTDIEELPSSMKHLTGLTLLNLKDCNTLSSFPGVICSLTSLEILTLSGCRGQPPKALHLLGLLPINLRLPKLFSGLSSLKSLDLSDCNLSDGALHDDLSCFSSLQSLILNKNNFTHLPDSISQLSKLKLLYLENCSKLQSLPYLPSSTNFVMARGCTSLENYSNKVVVWTLGEAGFTIINCLSLLEEEESKITEVSLLDSLLKDEVTDGSFMDIHFQPLWKRYMEDQIRESEGFYSVLHQIEIPEWFENQNCGSSVAIPLHRYTRSWRGIALCVDFEVHKNLNEVSPSTDVIYFDEFICHLDMDGGPIDFPLVYQVPRDKILVGSFGLWLYISHAKFGELLDGRDYIRPLIITNSLDIEIKGCGAHILYEPDVVGFVQHSSNKIFGSPDALCRHSEDFIKFHLGNSQSLDDKVETSQSNAPIDVNSQCFDDEVETGQSNAPVDVNPQSRDDEVETSQSNVPIDLNPQIRDDEVATSQSNALVDLNPQSHDDKVANSALIDLNPQSHGDKVATSQSNAVIDLNPQICDEEVETSQSNAPIDISDLELLLSRLHKGDQAQQNCYDCIFPEVAIPRGWFSNQNFESYIKMELPPTLHDNSTWLGFTIFAFYRVDKQQVGLSNKLDSTIFLRFSSLSASDEVPLTPYIFYPFSRDIFVESSQRLMVFYLPREHFQLNRCSHIWASFGSNNQAVKVEMCGIRLVYKQDVQEFVQTMFQWMLETPIAYHPSLYQNLLVQLEQLQDHNPERGICSSFSSERRPQAMPKLLSSNEIILKEGCTSPENQVCTVPGPTDVTVGLHVPLKELKTTLLKEEQHLLPTHPGGCGKTTSVKTPSGEIIGKKFRKRNWFWRSFSLFHNRSAALSCKDKQKGDEWSSINVKLYTYKELRTATENFIPVNKIGEGGFGCVYKGRLKDGKIAAIKILSAESKQGVREFLTEINVISEIEHENLVELYGCCVEEDHRILVYNYLENNSLAHNLIGGSQSNIYFNWQTRSKICIGIARGLAFLHEEVRPHIIHRDIKASNILLDKDLTPKISDFGLAKLIPSNMTHVSTRVAGTIGYLAPEYVIRGQLSRKTDIYSFGVLLVEIVSGRCNINTRLPIEEQYLLERTWELYERRELVRLVDTALNGDFDVEEACKFLKIGLLCTQDAPKLRPSMSTVVKMLTGKMDLDDNKITKPGLISDFMVPKVRGAQKKPDTTITSNVSSGSDNLDSSALLSGTTSAGTLTFTTLYDRSI